MNQKWNAAFAILLSTSACAGTTTKQPSPSGSSDAAEDADVAGNADAYSVADVANTDSTGSAETASPAVVDASTPDAQTTVVTNPDASADAALMGNFTISLAATAPVQRLDLLFMIDNSESMGDKQVLLADAVPDMLERLVTPNCVDANGYPNGAVVDANGACAQGSPEFAPIHDMHIGIVSSSLGGRGGAGARAPYASGDPCNPSGDGTIAANAPGTTPVHMNDKGELLNRAGEDEHWISNASPDNYLAWFPNVTANRGGGTAPQPAVTNVGNPVTVTVADVALNPLPDDTTLIGAFQDMLVGVHERGCGYEAQLESWYRFLIEPNPYSSISYSSDGVPVVSYVGVDATILQQRAAFLRPDSAVAVIVVTDENQQVVDPLQLSGTAWAFENATFPGSPGWPNYGATEGTKVCQTNPLDPDCACCATIADPTEVAADCQNQADSGPPVYYTPAALDEPNLRFYHMKQRFGVDVGYPSSRYVRGLTGLYVPKQSYDRYADGTMVACTNPLYAAALPTSATSSELCNLPANTTGRTPGGNLVYYAAITGVPHELLQSVPGDGECPATTAAGDCPQKSTLTAADWVRILGQDPENYNFTGVDFHMLESWVPRSQTVAQAAEAMNYSNCLPGSSDTCDPINGREYDTGAGQLGYADLEYACTFPLSTPKDCTQPQYANACDCQHDPDSGAPLEPNGTSSLCQQVGGVYTTTQTYGKAYPAIEELSVARQLGQFGIVSSLCPIHPVASSSTDPLYGYRPAVNAIVDRLKWVFEVSCNVPTLATDSSTGLVSQCVVLATFNDGSTTCAAAGPGYSDVTSGLADFKQAQHNNWVAAGGPAMGTPDPSTMLTCQLNEIPPPSWPAPADSSWCTGVSDRQGWCYVENASGGPSTATCLQQILFAGGGPPKNAALTLSCAGSGIQTR
jgi:hypothetical protein